MRIPKRRFVQVAFVGCLAALLAVTPALAQEEKPASKPAPLSDVGSPSQATTREAEESQAINKALEAGPSNPLVVIKNLEDFLERYPQSARRERVLRIIYKLAMQSNDSEHAATAAERLLEINPQDPELLTVIIELYNRQNEGANRQKALRYATSFVKYAEQAASEAPSQGPAANKVQDNLALVRATAYFLRGGVYAGSGDNAHAVTDFEKSMEVFPSAQTAERLGDAASKMGDTDRAIDAYATAFAFPDKSLEPAERTRLRKKLGSAYILKHPSEEGLGDLVLAHYDELTRSLESRLAGEERPNSGVRDPMEFVLERLDGTHLRLVDYHGKVVVMDFWATWCGPCRLEGKLFERVLETFRDNPGVAFLAVNVDEDRSVVRDFIRDEKWTTPVVYARGLDASMGVNALPTVMILDPQGRVAFRQAGLDLGGFVSTLETKIREVLARHGAAAVAATSP
jgi:thiol-disulfide isomerase/thioredoxin/regulator of sirC expression with transglutaminase-like and TPR domain